MSVFGKGSGNKKGKPTYAYSIIVVAFVLFLMAFLTWLFAGIYQKSKAFSEKLEVSAFIKPSVTKPEIDSLIKSVTNYPGVKTTKYCDKKCAEETWYELTKDDSWKEILGVDEQPFQESIDFTLAPSKAQADSFKIFKSRFEEEYKAYFDDVYTSQDTLEKIIRVSKIIGIAILVIFILLAIYAFLSIDSTIRLAMYSNRFLIKTMQMVGAKRRFIAKPIVLRAILNGAIAAAIGLALFYAAKQILQITVPDMRSWVHPKIHLWIIIIVFCTGIFISWYSTHRSILKYLKLKLDDLY